MFLMALNARGRFNKSSWIQCHRNHSLTMKVTNANALLLGNSIITGLARYQIVRKKYFASLKAVNLGIGGDRVEKVLWRAISLPLLSSVRNIVVQCGTNNVSTDSPRNTADCIVDEGTIFWRKSNTVNIICGLIPRDECWSVNILLINKVNDILKYECHKNSFVFIVQDHGWTLSNGSLDCSLFCKDSLHFVEQGNVKQAKSIVSTLTAQNNQISFSSKNCNTLYSDVSKQSVPAAISFSFKEDDFSPLTNICRPVSKSGSCSNMLMLKVSLFRLMLVDM